MSYTLEDIKKGIIGTDETGYNSVSIRCTGIERILVDYQITFKVNSEEDLIIQTLGNGDAIIATRNWVEEAIKKDSVSINTAQTILGPKIFKHNVFITDKKFNKEEIVLYQYTKYHYDDYFYNLYGFIHILEGPKYHVKTHIIENSKEEGRFLVFFETLETIQNQGDPQNQEYCDFSLYEFTYGRSYYTNEDNIYGYGWNPIYIVDQFKVYNNQTKLMKSVKANKPIGTIGIYNYNESRETTSIKFYKDTILISSVTGYTLNNNNNNENNNNEWDNNNNEDNNYTNEEEYISNNNGSLLIYKKINGEWKLWCYGTNILGIEDSYAGEGAGIIDENHIVLTDRVNSKLHFFNIESETYPFELTLDKKVQEEPPEGIENKTRDGRNLIEFGTGLWVTDRFLFVTSLKTERNGQHQSGVLQIWWKNPNRPYSELNRFVPYITRVHFMHFDPTGATENRIIPYGHFNVICNDNYGLVIGKNCIDVYKFEQERWEKIWINEIRGVNNNSIISPFFGKIKDNYIILYNNELVNGYTTLNPSPSVGEAYIYVKKEDGTWTSVEKIKDITSGGGYGSFMAYSYGYLIYEKKLQDETYNYSHTYQIVAKRISTVYPLEIDSNKNGILISRLSQRQIDNIRFPEPGTILYNSSFNKFQIRTENRWEYILTSSDYDQLIYNFSNQFVSRSTFYNSLQNYATKQYVQENYVKLEDFYNTINSIYQTFNSIYATKFELEDRIAEVYQYLGENMLTISGLPNFLESYLTNNHYVNQDNITQYIPVAYIEQIIQNYLNNQGGQ